MFPSPYGELHFSMVHENTEVAQKAVSVPLRGITFLNIKDEVARAMDKQVSVPLRGITFLNSV